MSSQSPQWKGCGRLRAPTEESATAPTFYRWEIRGTACGAGGWEDHTALRQVAEAPPPAPSQEATFPLFHFIQQTAPRGPWSLGNPGKELCFPCRQCDLLPLERKSSVMQRQQDAHPGGCQSEVPKRESAGHAPGRAEPRARSSSF